MFKNKVKKAIAHIINLPLKVLDWKRNRDNKRFLPSNSNG